VRVSVRVRPGSSAIAVGGSHDGALVVRVRAPAREGRATEEALRALADALGVAGREVRLVRGASSRSKIVEVPDEAGPRLAQLLDSHSVQP
jgi:uncharacterized protein (TIGR00251 family)